jgi:hypothetical protein
MWFFVSIQDVAPLMFLATQKSPDFLHDDHHDMLQQSVGF